MKIKYSFLFEFIFAGIMLNQFSLAASEVIHFPGENQDIFEKWQWAIDRTGTQDPHDSFWIGYSIERMMKEGSFIGSYNSHGNRDRSLSELIYGENRNQSADELSGDEEVRKQARQVLRDL